MPLGPVQDCRDLRQVEPLSLQGHTHFIGITRTGVVGDKDVVAIAVLAQVWREVEAAHGKVVRPVSTDFVLGHLHRRPDEDQEYHGH